MQPSKLQILFVVPAFCVLASCASSPPQSSMMSAPVAEPPPPPPPPPSDPLPLATPLPAAPSGNARIRAIHASPDSMAGAVAVYLDNATTAAIPNLTFRSAAGYTEVAAGAHSVQARLAGAPATSAPALMWQTPAFEPGHSYTIIAHGMALEAPNVTFAPEEDTATTTPPNMALVRFFHALVGASPVDICVGSTAVFANVSYGSFANGSQGRYSPVPAGSARLDVRATATAPCTGRSMGHVSATVEAGQVLTLVATGRVGRRAQAVTPELLACRDAPLNGAPSACVPVPIVP